MEDRAEVNRLKHTVRVLEGALKIEKGHVRDYDEELHTKIKELEELKVDYGKIVKKVELLHDMTDLKDELAHSNECLAKAEKTIVDYKRQLSSLEGAKEKVVELENQVGGLTYKAQKCEEYKLVRTSPVAHEEYFYRHCFAL